MFLCHCFCDHRGETIKLKKKTWKYLIFKKLMNRISVKTVNNKNFPHQLQKKRERKNRGSKGQEWKSTKGKTTDPVLALLKIQNKFILDDDTVTFPNDNTPKLLLVLFSNRQENERVILKYTGNTQSLCSQNHWKEHHLLKQGHHHSPQVASRFL